MRLTSRLTHLNTVAIYDYGRTADRVFYYAMEFLDGMNLEELVGATGPLAPARVVHILRQVSGALAEAHGVGLIHRDVKPANIILCERGGVPDIAKVVDFGLAREVVREEGETALTASNVNTLLGTPLYLSPEAIADPESVDGRSDLYALGAVGYFLLTGKTLFEAKSIMELCGHHLHSRPIPPSVRGGRDIPRDLEELVLRCVEKDPAARPVSAAAFRASLLDLRDVEWSEADARKSWTALRDALRASEATERAVNPHTMTIDVRRWTKPSKPSSRMS